MSNAIASYFSLAWHWFVAISPSNYVNTAVWHARGIHRPHTNHMKLQP
jgi:hypothetical protein